MAYMLMFWVTCSLGFFHTLYRMQLDKMSLLVVPSGEGWPLLTFLLVHSLSLGSRYFSPRKGCPKVIQFYIDPILYLGGNFKYFGYDFWWVWGDVRRSLCRYVYWIFSAHVDGGTSDTGKCTQTGSNGSGEHSRLQDFEPAVHSNWLVLIHALEWQLNLKVNCRY